MNGYLVVLRHLSDDLPVGLFSSRQAAGYFAATLDEMPTKEIREIYQTDCSTPCAVAIVEFKEGKPVSCSVVRDLNAEEQTERIL